MGNRIVLVLSIFFIAPKLAAQLAPTPHGPAGFAVNLGPLVSTKAMLPALAIWYTVAEPAFEKQARAFSNQYVERLKYYVGTPFDNGNKAKAGLKKVTDRLDSLTTRNNALGPIYVFRKKDTESRLKIIKAQLDLISKDISKLSLTGIYGERVNLNQNTAMELEAYNRKLDTIETFIYNTSVINKIFK